MMSSKQEDPPEGERGSGGAAPGARSERSEPIRGGQPPGEPAAIALRMEDLTLWALERAAKMPRDHKFTVGDRLVETCLDVNAALVEASFVRDKLGLLHTASSARACWCASPSASGGSRPASAATSPARARRSAASSGAGHAASARAIQAPPAPHPGRHGRRRTCCAGAAGTTTMPRISRPPTATPITRRTATTKTGFVAPRP
jgi:hypothetical protein